jgi:hypothetical protein
MKRLLLILTILIAVVFASATPATAYWRRGYYYGAAYRPYYGAYYRPYYYRPYRAYYYPGYYGAYYYPGYYGAYPGYYGGYYPGYYGAYYRGYYPRVGVGVGVY